MFSGRTSKVGELIAMGAAVRWKCHECGGGGVADLAAMLAAKGPDFDLIDQHPRCKTPGCEYRVTFYAQVGPRNWNLYTEAGLSRYMRWRSAWLIEQWSRKGVP